MVNTYREEMCLTLAMSKSISFPSALQRFNGGNSGISFRKESHLSVNFFLSEPDQSMDPYKGDLLLSHPYINGGGLNLKMMRQLLDCKIRMFIVHGGS